MVTTSYPRFPGDSVGTFMEPIAASVAARGHEVHVVAPWHPLVARAPEERGVRFHFYKYAPFRALNVFGYAAALRADVKLRGAALAAAPLALAAGWFAALRVARRVPGDRHARPLGGARWIHRMGGGTSAAAGRQPSRIRCLRRRDVRAGATSGAAGFRSRRRHHSLQRGSGAAVDRRWAPIPRSSKSCRTASTRTDSARSRSNARRCARNWAWRRARCSSSPRAGWSERRDSST